jgi:hypothetical protein
MTFQEQIQQGIPSVLPKNPTKQISITHQNAKKSFRQKKKNWHYAMPYGILNRNITLN